MRKREHQIRSYFRSVFNSEVDDPSNFNRAMVVNGERYSFRERGAVHHIIDGAGNKVSDDFHEFHIVTTNIGRENEVVGIVAEVGALKYILSLPTEDNPRFDKATKGYHEFFVRDGVLYGQIGAIVEKIASIKNENTTLLPPVTE